MFRRMVIRLRLRSAAKAAERFSGIIMERMAEAEAMHPESLHRFLMELEIDTVLMPAWQREKQLVVELAQKLKAT